MQVNLSLLEFPFQKQVTEIICSYTFKKLHVSGHYVPQLAKLMIKMNTKKKIFNLKGIAVSVINQRLSYLS